MSKFPLYLGIILAAITSSQASPVLQRLYGGSGVSNAIKDLLAQTSQVRVHTAIEHNEQLPSGWIKCHNSSCGKDYYHDTISLLSQPHPPDASGLSLYSPANHQPWSNDTVPASTDPLDGPSISQKKRKKFDVLADTREERWLDEDVAFGGALGSVDDEQVGDPIEGGHVTDHSGHVPGGLVPFTHEAILHGKGGAVTCLDANQDGSILLAGGLDDQLHTYDFKAMTSKLTSTHHFEPQPGFPLVEAKMCPHAECGPYGKHSGEGAKGQIVLASTSARHATLVTHGAAFSPGKRIVEFKYGYQFLQEMRNTDGHIGSVVAGWWHPSDANRCMTASIDGTVRLWDVESCMKGQINLLILSSPSRSRVPVLAAVGTRGGALALGSDGILRLWDSRTLQSTRVLRPTAQLQAQVGEDAGGAPSSVTIARNGVTVVTRGGGSDNTVRVWDLRKPSEVVKIFGGWGSAAQGASMTFSPSGRVLAVGTTKHSSAEDGEDGEKDRTRGSVEFVDMSTLEVVKSAKVRSGGVRSLLWQERTDQLFLGTTGGRIHVWYTADGREGGVLDVPGLERIPINSKRNRKRAKPMAMETKIREEPAAMFRNLGELDKDGKPAGK